MIRQELPYDIEIAVRDDRIGFICHTEWLRKDLKVVCIGQPGERKQAIMTGQAKETVLTGLVEGNTYHIRISRNDILGLKYNARSATVKTSRKPYIVLVGASVGYAWNLPALPARWGRDDFVFGYRRGKEGFDKTNVLVHLLNSLIVPDIIIIKECAAYFPREISSSIEKIDSWIRLLKEKGIVPILATVAPVSAECERKRGLDGMILSINQFNERLREYAHTHGISVLDLNKALEDGSNEHYLIEEFSQPDGLHLNEKAYRIALDPLIMPVISGVSGGGS